MPNSSHRAPRPGSTARGLGYHHQQHRTRLLLRHVDGTSCWWCAQAMYREPKRNWDSRQLHADHSRSRSTYGVGNTTANRLLHATCNERRGDGSRDDQRPALTLAESADSPNRAVHPDLGELTYFDWPDLPR
ncbi:hypothetical protein MINTM001_17170 [Mycobacterium paraintracellulare]|uniref:hypothetical protein n=1 Tax=Mycobacterium paraintracellulare TaxID=1138383 RepID=UPI001934ECFE|nr:hypothetical protein [Mycobacterium paraintracellulare]BCO40578.1 hypothetical protein MINTM001_17170 [Mycobacterium paraintracellulare]